MSGSIKRDGQPTAMPVTVRRSRSLYEYFRVEMELAKQLPDPEYRFVIKDRTDVWHWGRDREGLEALPHKIRNETRRKGVFQQANALLNSARKGAEMRQWATPEFPPYRIEPKGRNQIILKHDDCYDHLTPADELGKVVAFTARRIKSQEKANRTVELNGPEVEPNFNLKISHAGLARDWMDDMNTISARGHQRLVAQLKAGRAPPPAALPGE
jgi:hypothetical protein